MTDCPICELRKEVDSLKIQQETDRKSVNGCWVRGGMLNDTDETTVITIDASISREQKNKMMALLREIEAKQ